MLTYFRMWAHEIRKFHAAVMQQRLRNVQKSVMHMQSCFFANVNLLFFCCSSSPLQKLPIVVIQKFCNQGNEMSHFSLLSDKIPVACCCPLPSGKILTGYGTKLIHLDFLKEMHLNPQYSTYSGEEKFLLLCFSR